MVRYERADWARLGQAVYEARTEAGLSRTSDWVEKVQRSSRVLLGLERGEKVGTGTLDAIEDALGWPRGGCFRVLTGGVGWRALSLEAPAEVESAGETDALAALRLVVEELRGELQELRSVVDDKLA